MHLPRFLGTSHVTLNLLQGTQWENEMDSAYLHPVGGPERSTHITKQGASAAMGEAWGVLVGEPCDLVMFVFTNSVL